jgi:2-polyprenyl-3-methyl-5-hydroxy-6-metoxy-1,4-benzoquinol methylase
MDYLAINKELWNEKVAHHVVSDFYEQTAFLAGKNSLKPIELALLGDVSGKRILHLQCHFGQDSLSLARMGAHVTGVDFSEKAIDLANDLKEKLNLSAEFICCDIYNLPAFLNARFSAAYAASSEGAAGRDAASSASTSSSSPHALWLQHQLLVAH